MVVPVDIMSTTSVKAFLKQEFKDAPVMVDIASCESYYRQFDKNGNALRGIVNNKDVGVFMINEIYHLERAKKLGIDINTFEGNVKFARLLYQEQGTKPWNWSKYPQGKMRGWINGECS